ncbi:MAG: hypothetical protein ACJ788_04030 [Ktedonobacteraceae bacterium]|jgi:hypothetical protein
MSRHQSTWILVAFLLLLIGCTSPSTQNVASVSTRPPTYIPTATSTPIPPIPTIGSVPRNCPTSNPNRHVFPQLFPVIGSTPVWATWAPGPSVYREGPVTSSSPYDPAYGWEMTKVIWEVGPNYTHTIAIRGYELFDHTPVLIQLNNDTPTANAVLDPQNPGHPKSVIGDGWAEWGSYIVVPKAGCYSLEVSWPTGYWTVTFAFGA